MCVVRAVVRTTRVSNDTRALRLENDSEISHDHIQSSTQRLIISLLKADASRITTVGTHGVEVLKARRDKEKEAAYR